MSRKLDTLLEELAAHLAHDRRWSLAQAHRYVAGLARIARHEYAQLGASYGDDDDGFLRWWLTRRSVTPSA